MQMWHGVSPIPAQMWEGEPSPGADVAWGEPSPGADVAWGEPSPGADVAACLLSQRGRRLSVAALRLCGSLDFAESREWPASVATKCNMERECPNDATHAAGTVAE